MGLADLARLDPALRLDELGLEAPHEAELEDDSALLGRGAHLVALLERKRHRLLAEHVLAGGGREHPELRMRERRRRDHDSVEGGAGERLLEARVRRDAELGARFASDLLVRVDDAGELGGGQPPARVDGMHHAAAPGAGDGEAERAHAWTSSGGETSRSTTAR